MPRYDTDLAYIHDVGYGDFAARGGAAILKLLRAAQIRSGRVVDLGCGSGIWARQLIDAGYEVVGIDASRAMLKIARGRVPEAKFRHASVLTCAIPPCRAVTAMGEVFNYACFEAGRDALTSILQRMYDALEPGGLAIFDIAEPGRSRGQKQGHRTGSDWACLVNYEHDETRATLARHIQTFRRVGKLFRRDEETHHLQLFRAAEVMRQLRAIGFRVRRMQSYGEVKFPPAVTAFVARKVAGSG